MSKSAAALALAGFFCVCEELSCNQGPSSATTDGDSSCTRVERDGEETALVVAASASAPSVAVMAAVGVGVDEELS